MQRSGEGILGNSKYKGPKEGKSSACWRNEVWLALSEKGEEEKKRISGARYRILGFIPSALIHMKLVIPTRLQASRGPRLSLTQHLVCIPGHLLAAFSFFLKLVFFWPFYSMVSQPPRWLPMTLASFCNPLSHWTRAGLLWPVKEGRINSVWCSRLGYKSHSSTHIGLLDFLLWGRPAAMGTLRQQCGESHMERNWVPGQEPATNLSFMCMSHLGSGSSYPSKAFRWL